MKPTILLLITLTLAGFSAKENIDPTGTYKFDGKTKKKKGDMYGYSGKIQVKKHTINRIIMTFEVNKGAPSYNSGSFVDTLEYNDNKTIYTNPDLDQSCKITFEFTNKGVIVKEKTDHYNFGCGFGHAVQADGYYKRISRKEPELRQPLTNEKLK